MEDINKFIKDASLITKKKDITEKEIGEYLRRIREVEEITNVSEELQIAYDLFKKDLYFILNHKFDG